jgi:hypothetical protein
VYKQRILSLCVLFIVIFLNASIVAAGRAKLTWKQPTTNTDGTTLTDLGGYKIYYGISPGNYSEVIDVGKVTKYTIADLPDGFTYYFVVTAYNTLGYESEYSNEVSKMIPYHYSVSPMSVNLGRMKVGGSSIPRMVTIKNMSNSDLAINSITISGANESEFIQTSDCSTIPSGSSCAVAVTFRPVAPFSKKGAIMSISFNDPKKPTVNVKLSGKAPPPRTAVSRKSVDFGSVGVGFTSLPKIVAIKNVGTSDLTVNAITFGGTNAGEFSETNSCKAIVKGSSCAITVTFSPASNGKKNAMIGISSNDPKKPVINIKISGSGFSPSTGD